jgi:tetratricopeptide (TPR) repeat protein
MAESPAKTIANTAGKAAPVAADAPRSRVDWRTVWPVPALAGATVLLIGGLAVGFLRAPKDDPAAPLIDAAKLVEEAKFDEAILRINEEVVPAAQKGMLTKEKQAQMHLLRARSISQGQAKLGISRRENHQAVIADLDKAKELGHTLTPGEQILLSDSLIAIGDTTRATEIAEKLPTTEAPRRRELYQKVVEANLRASDVKYEATLEVLSRILDEPSLTADDRAWAVARQTELRLAKGFHDEAISKLLQSMPRLEGINASTRGELLYLLGKAYFQQGERQRSDPGLFAQAENQLIAALDELDVQDPKRQTALLLLARIMQATGRIDEAREAFEKVRDEGGDTAPVLAATLGVAEALSVQGDDDAAVQFYNDVLEKLPKLEDQRTVNPSAVAASLMERQTDRSVRNQFQRSLQYAQLAERAYRQAGEVPPELLLALAQTHRAVAEAALEEARAGRAIPDHPANHADHTSATKSAPASNHAEHEAAPADASSPAATAAVQGVSPVTASTAKRHFYEAALNYKAHADAVVVRDNTAYTRSLFNAADCFDLAADRTSAKVAFSTYIEGAANDDPRRHEARFRLAQIFQSERDYTAAAEQYRRLAGRDIILVDGKPTLGKATDAPRAGEWADRSVVPLARCLLQDTDPDNDEQARELLTEVVDGRWVTPKSDIFRDAVTELGELEYAQGKDYARAIALLRRAEGYENHPRLSAVKYKLADANRLSAAEIAAELRQNMPQAQRIEKEKTREQRLRLAATKFQEVVDNLSHKRPEQASAFDRVMLRNSMFYLGDCAFDLGTDFTAAIAAYDLAAQRYASEPSALVARTQIVAAYVAMGKWEEARRANELAKRHLKSLPEEALNDPDLPMQRRHWQRWFDATSELDRRAAAAAAARNNAQADADASKP